MSSKVLVPMSREAADQLARGRASQDADADQFGAWLTGRDALRDALNTDREQQVELVARALYREASGGFDGWGYMPESRGEGAVRGMYRSKARAVLSALEPEEVCRAD